MEKLTICPMLGVGCWVVGGGWCIESYLLFSGWKIVNCRNEGIMCVTQDRESYSIFTEMHSLL